VPRISRPKLLLLAFALAVAAAAAFIFRRPEQTNPIPNQKTESESKPTLSIYASDLGSPRDLELDPAGHLLVSLPDRGQVVTLPEKQIVTTYGKIYLLNQ